MGTPNFASPSNASKYFVVLTNREEEFKQCPECNAKYYEWEEDLKDLHYCKECDTDITYTEIESETIYPEHWECEEFIANIKEEILSLPNGYRDNTSFNDRNYERSSLGKLSESKCFGDIDVTVNIIGILQSAYYEGATLDYLVELKVNGNNYDISTGSHYDENVDDVLESEYSEMSKGLQVIQRRNAEKWVDNTIVKLSEQLEAIFENFTEHKLKCTAVFSNGEAVYEHTN